jgi:hypothetical protein
MGETQNLGNASNSAASGPNAMTSNKMGKEVNNPEAQMDIDLEEDDLLGEENDLSDAVQDRWMCELQLHWYLQDRQLQRACSNDHHS